MGLYDYGVHVRVVPGDPFNLRPGQYAFAVHHAKFYTYVQELREMPVVPYVQGFTMPTKEKDPETNACCKQVLLRPQICARGLINAAQLLSLRGSVRRGRGQGFCGGKPAMSCLIWRGGCAGSEFPLGHLRGHVVVSLQRNSLVHRLPMRGWKGRLLFPVLVGVRCCKMSPRAGNGGYLVCPLEDTCMRTWCHFLWGGWPICRIRDYVGSGCGVR